MTAQNYRKTEEKSLSSIKHCYRDWRDGKIVKSFDINPGVDIDKLQYYMCWEQPLILELRR